MNGEDKADSGVDTQNSEGNAEEEEVAASVYYDKTKSFFDNISCDDNRYEVLWLAWTKMFHKTTALIISLFVVSTLNNAPF